MEGKIHFLKKRAAGAARTWILYRPPPLENLQNFRKGGSVRNYCDPVTSRWASVLLPFLKQFSLPLSPYTNPGLNGKYRYPVENSNFTSIWTMIDINIWEHLWLLTTSESGQVHFLPGFIFMKWSEVAVWFIEDCYNPFISTCKGIQFVEQVNIFPPCSTSWRF